MQMSFNMTFSTQMTGRLKGIWHTLSQRPDRAIARRGGHWLRVALLGLGVLATVACSGSDKSSSSPPGAEAGAPGAEAGAPGAAGATAGAPSCDYQGESHAVGESFKCDCNECTCMENGVISSTAVACLPCLYGGKEIISGTTFPDRDGCNSCTCEQATVSCTKTACTCHPAKEWWRNYVATSSKECMLVDFACDNGTKPFANDCGCGCEEPDTCPQFAQCDPAYDCAKVLADCPYVAAAP